jgi:hypothetical protein
MLRRLYTPIIDQLRDIDSHLADEFDRVSRELERRTISFDIKSRPPGFYDAQTTQHRILSENRDDVVPRIREREGFAHFLQAVPFTSLQVATEEGPVTIVNISRYRSDSIILQQREPPVLVQILHRPELWRNSSSSPSRNHYSTLDASPSRIADSVNFQPCPRAQTQDRYIVRQLPVNAFGHVWTINGVFDGAWSLLHFLTNYLALLSHPLGCHSPHTLFTHHRRRHIAQAIRRPIDMLKDGEGITVDIID